MQGNPGPARKGCEASGNLMDQELRRNNQARPIARAGNTMSHAPRGFGTRTGASIAMIVPKDEQPVSLREFQLCVHPNPGALQYLPDHRA